MSEIILTKAQESIINSRSRSARKPFELDKAVDELSLEVKRQFINELGKGSLGRADQVTGINDIWVSARLNARLLKPAYFLEIKGSGNGI